MMHSCFSLSRSALFLTISLLVACGGDVASTDSGGNTGDDTSSSGSPSSSPEMPSNVSQGKQLYDSLGQGCLSCHGADGQATTVTPSPIDLNASTYQHSSVPGTEYSLEEYIELWMPVSDPSICLGNCATNIAAYIRFLADPNNQTPVQQQLVANASSSSNLQGFAPLNVDFNASQSAGEIASYQWVFGDGETGSGLEQEHIYNTPGTYQAQLTVTDTDGNTDSTSLTVVVQADSAPTANISASAITGIAPLTIQFDGSSSSDDQGIDLYEWTVVGTSTYNYGVNAEYTFSEPGTYDVLLTVSDTSGLEATTTQTITVASPGVNIAPVADASRSTNLTGPAPLSVNFNASASADDRNEIASYSWDFGNGQQAQGVTATQVFNTVGEYSVTLTVTDAEGLTGNTVISVRVDNSNQAPQAAITALDSTTGLAPYTMDFSSANSSDDSGITQWSWDVNGDNNPDSTLANPSFNFAQAGSYTVRLTVSDAQGVSDSDTLSVQVLDSAAFAESRYQANCSSCHGANGEGGPGTPALTRTWTMPELEPDVDRMISLYNADCQGVAQSACANALATYIIDQFSPTSGEPPINEDVDAHLISVPVKALTEEEFFNTVAEVFSVSFTDSQKLTFNLPLDSSATRYSTDSSLRVLRGISSDPAVLDDLYPALTAVNNALLDNLTDSSFQNQYGSAAGCSFASVASSDSCRGAYRSEILSKAFRRTVNSSDYAFSNATSAYAAFINSGLDERDAFVNSMVSYTLFSPEFIFHSYRGQSVSEGYQLTNEELAHKIAYLVWGTPADSGLLSRDWNSLLAGEDDALLDSELLRLFSDQRSKYFVDTFLKQWLRLETDVAQELASTSDSARADEFAAAIKAESENFIRYLITQNEGINSIINANYTFMNSALADYYQISIPGLGSDFTQVNLNDYPALANRQGLLTQANFLTTGSKSDRPGTVHRGVTILKDVMCYTIGPPSGEDPDTGGIDRTQHTESALFRMVTETPGSACIGCHQHINPISFPFEAFDRFGRHPLALSNGGSLPEYSVYEAIGVASNPNANGPVEKADTFYLDERDGDIDFVTHHGRSISGSFSDHRGLIDLIDQSPAFGECLNDNLYDFIIGTDAEKGTTASSPTYASQHLAQTTSKQVALEGVLGIRTLIANLVKRPEFRLIRRD